MKMLFDIEEVYKMINDSLPMECYCCGKTFYVKRKDIRRELKRADKISSKNLRFCSRKCFNYEKRMEMATFNCLQCGIQVTRQKVASENKFCNKSCAATYNNTHKKSGTRRSKLEAFIQEEIQKEFVNLEVLYNDKTLINSELDFYIPSLKLAIELNGIFHYEPIYGEDKLKSIQNNDNRKFQACIEKGIELAIIDSSSLNYFKVEKALKYYHIIRDLIYAKINSTTL